MDILIDPYRYVPATPACFPVIQHVKQLQNYGGASVGDGMVQSGPAVDGKTSFRASLLSYITEPFDARADAIPPAYYTVTTPLTVFGGLGTMYTTDDFGDFRVKNTAGNGRFNTTANVAGKYGETAYECALDLTASYSAFGCFYMDLGDFGGELEIDLFNGASLVRTIAVPTKLLSKATASECGWISFSDGSLSFNRVLFKMRQFNFNPGEYDYVGLDDITVGHCMTCVPRAGYSVHYGINTAATTAKTVAGPALTARNAFAAVVDAMPGEGLGQYGWEDQSAGAGSVGTLTFAGTSVTATWNPLVYENLSSDPDDTNIEVSASFAAGEYAIADSAGSARWNTTSGGTKWLEFKSTLVLNFSHDINNIGFYITDLGQQNATLRVTLRQYANPTIDEGPAVVHYVPKAAELASPNGLLRFWGVTNEISFKQVVIQVVYYDDLTPGTYSKLPAWVTAGAIETVGIDDILIG